MPPHPTGARAGIKKRIQGNSGPPLGSNRQGAVAGGDFPGGAGLGVADDGGGGVQGDGGANVPGDAVEGVADFMFVGVRGFDDQMFLAVRYGGGFGEVQEMHTGVWAFGSDGFVAEVEAQAVAAGLADDAGEN